MNMIPKMLILPALIAAATGVAAQTNPASSVVLYGLLDSGVEIVSNVGAGGKSLTRVPTNTGTFPSRWGLRGSEDLGDGLRAVFTLESGIGVDTGALLQGGRIFGRSAFVGLAGGWGSVTLGRQYTMLFYALLDADLLGPNIYSSSSLDSYIANDRVDNSIAYRGTFNGFTIGATYSRGRDTVNAGPSIAGTNCPGESSADTKACIAWSGMLKYDTPSWGAAVAIDRLNGGPGAFGALSSSALSDTRYSVNGYYKIGAAKIGGGLLRRRNQGSVTTPASDLWYLGMAYSVTPAITLDGELFRLSYDNSANKANLFALRATYAFSKRTAAYMTGGYIANDGSLAGSVSGGGAGTAPLAGGSQTGLMVGLRHSF